MKYLSAILILLLFVSASTPSASGQELRNGKWFDPGVEMTKRAEGAPEQLDEMAYLIGQWDVAYETFPTDTTSHKAQGMARVMYMNRGHGIMEQFYSPDFDGQGHELNTLSFLGYNLFRNIWNLGEVNSHTESIAVYDGDMEGNDLVMRNAIRRGGNAQVTYYRVSYKKGGQDGYTFEVETSGDHGKTWTPSLRKTYTRRTASDTFLASSSEYGSPAPNLPEEARQFDFLLGYWAAAQELTFPNGQVAKFPSLTSAVHALNGHAILEFNWYDVDPQLPDASTSIVRIYNRSMRRWESLFVTNRGNGMLFFGGAWEDDRMVLHNFESHTSDPINHYIFHSIESDSYKWFAESSNDRGQTFNTNWIIEVTRK